MSLLTKILIVALYALILLIIIWLIAQLGKMLVKTFGIVGSGFADFLKVALYLMGLFGGVYLILFLWDTYGKDYE